MRNVTVEGKKSKLGSSKRGSMLVLVLIIMVVGLIFIASALMLTNTTRQRYYEDSESSQARLTVGSVAESFYQAVYIQEITDDQLEALASGKAVLTFSSSSSVPGVSGGASTTATFSKTTVAGVSRVTIVFSTTIDGQTENVRMTLEKTETTPPTVLFSSPYESGGGNMGNLNLGSTGTMAGVTDNYAIIHGDGIIAHSGSTSVYSTIITDSVITAGSGITLFDDVVFYGPNAGFNVTGSNGQGFNINTDSGSAYFICPDGQGTGSALYNGTTAFNSTTALSTSGHFVADNVVFYNFNLNLGSNTDVASGYFNTDTHDDNYVYMYGNGTLTGANAALSAEVLNSYAEELVHNSDIQALRDQVSAYLASDAKSLLSTGILDSATARSSFGDPYSRADATTFNLAGVGNGQRRTLNAGAYILSGNLGNNSSMGNALNTRVVCDLSQGDYTFYVDNDMTIYGGFFEVINGAGSDNWVRFILADDVSLTIGTNANPCGILSTSREAGEAQPIGEKPHVQILGADRNTVTIGNQTTVDAYIGCYGTSGSVLFSNCPATGFYGRVCAQYAQQTDGEFATIPYCPSPNATEVTNAYVVIYSDYSVDDFEYFY